LIDISIEFVRDDIFLHDVFSNEFIVIDTCAIVRTKSLFYFNQLFMLCSS